MAEKQFEEALHELEALVQRLEDADLPLDDALALFEEGIRLSKICAHKLDEAEKKVELLLKDEGGNLLRKPFDETGDE